MLTDDQDICARSPVTETERDIATPRHSLDARRFRQPTLGSSAEPSPPLPPQRPLPTQSLPDKYLNPPEEQPEDRFEDVGLDEDASATEAKPSGKRQGIFARFGGGTEVSSAASRPGSSAHFWGRKRGTSGQGAELGSLDGERNVQDTSRIPGVAGGA